MKRSQIDLIIDNSLLILKKYQVYLPNFGYWKIDEWKKKELSLYQEIIDVSLGWDITDMGGEFKNIGLVLFTLRNGILNHSIYTKPYAEKILICLKGQKFPFHFHWHKTEDIINRHGGVLYIQLYNSNKDETIDFNSDVCYKIDGRSYKNKAGYIVKLLLGEGITLPPYLYHSFWTEAEETIAVEISNVNDDNLDNCFIDNHLRFTNVIEDCKQKWILGNEYNKLLK